MTTKPPKSELTLAEFAEAVGRKPSTIRRHLQAKCRKNQPGPLHGKTAMRHGRHFFPAYLIAWYKENVKSYGWDQRRQA